jgi:heme exporter protein A
MLQATQLSAHRGPATVFTRLDLRVEPGRALVVTGRNGSGKTTLLRTLAGLTQPAEGGVTWNGVPTRDARAHLAFAGHAPALKDELTVAENLHALVSLAGDAPGADATGRALADAGLDAQRDSPARALSAGQRRRVGLARLALTPRPLWLLDEPATALDAPGLRLLTQLLCTRLREGGAIVVATHQPIDLPAERTGTLELT